MIDPSLTNSITHVPLLQRKPIFGIRKYDWSPSLANGDFGDLKQLPKGFLLAARFVDRTLTTPC